MNIGSRPIGDGRLTFAQNEVQSKLELRYLGVPGLVKLELLVDVDVGTSKDPHAVDDADETKMAGHYLSQESLRFFHLGRRNLDFLRDEPGLLGDNGLAVVRRVLSPLGSYLHETDPLLVVVLVDAREDVLVAVLVNDPEAVRSLLIEVALDHAASQTDAVSQGRGLLLVFEVVEHVVVQDGVAQRPAFLEEAARSLVDLASLERHAPDVVGGRCWIDSDT